MEIENGKEHECLIDTGADCSIINKKNLPRNKKLFKSEVRLKAVTGDEIAVAGSVKGIIATIGDRKICMNAIVATNSPNYTIIGADTIQEFPEILEDVINRFNSLKETDYKKINTVELEILEKETKKSNSEIFKIEISPSDLCNSVKHAIITNEERPIFQQNARIPPSFEKAIDEEIEKLKRLGIIRDSSGPWCSRIVPVSKPDGSLRMCMDYRPLNEVTVKDRYPIPKIADILNSLTGAKIFSRLDATSGYHQIGLNEEDIEKTAFAYKNGFYEYTRMPFGLCNAPATFQRAMDTIFRKERGKMVFPYLDDIIVYSKTIEEHQEHLKVVFGKLKAANIALNEKKCNMFKEELKILGFIISEGTVKTDPEKVLAIKSYPKPTIIKELRSFLGMTGFCREFIGRYAQIVEPLEKLLVGETKRSIKVVKWNDKANNAFKEIKKIIEEQTERALPDFTNRFVLITDASNEAMGAILAQEDKNGKRKMISAFSKRLDKAQLNYSVTDKELLAIVKACEHYRFYLVGKEFDLETDHKALAYMKQCVNPTSRLLRWSLKLQEFAFKIKYIKGEDNAADGFSRINGVNKIHGELQKLMKKQKQKQ